MAATCKTCRHYGFYQMITGGPYGYAGPIPCANCSRFSWDNDNYEPVSFAPPEETTVKRTDGKGSMGVGNKLTRPLNSCPGGQDSIDRAIKVEEV